ncbi:hypothetical protein ABBQ38_004770 [Trebouxia sp. C0009 RCD-2024]
MPVGVGQAARAALGRSRRGLFGGKRRLSGNKVSEDGDNKSRRCWNPNVQKTTLYSSTLDRNVQLKVTTYALRCIDKAGGLDRYLLKSSDQELGSDVGSRLRAEIVAKQSMQKLQSAQQNMLPFAASAEQPSEPI